MLEIIPRNYVHPVLDLDIDDCYLSNHRSEVVQPSCNASILPFLNEPTALNIARNCPFTQLQARDGYGNTPLLWGCSEGREDIVDVLLYRGVDTNMQNLAGETSLYIAAARGYVSICQKLLDFGANPNISNLDGATPMHIAASSGNVGVLYMLLSYGAYINAQDQEGDTALHWSVREGKLEAVEFLVESKADILLWNEDLETPLHLASCLEEDIISGYLSGIEKKRYGGRKIMEARGQEPK